MARVRPLKEQTTAVPPLPPLEDQPSAATDQAMTDLPNSKPTFFDLLASMPAEEWEHCVVYLYRLSPRIDTQSESAYIEKRTSAFDAEDVLQAHGSGRYMAILKDTSLRKKLHDHKFSVYHPNLAPKVDPAHVLRTAENEAYWQSWGKKSAEALVVPAAGVTQGNGGNGAGPGEAAVAAIKEMAEVARRAQDAPVRPIADPRLMELWESTAKDRDELAQRLADRQAGTNIDPMNLLDQVFTTAERLRAPSSQESPMQIVREVLSTVKAMQEAAPQGKAVSPMESFKEFVATAQMIRESFAPPQPAESEPASTGDTRPPTWVQALGAIAPAFAPLIQAAAARMLSPSPLPPVPSNAPSLPGAAAPPPNSKQEASPSNPAPPSFIEQIAPLVLNAISVGADGTRFADSLCVMYGPMAYQTICALGQDGILAAMKGYPPLWQQLAGIEPQVKQFIEEFLAYGEEQAEDGQATEQATATA